MLLVIQVTPLVEVNSTKQHRLQKIYWRLLIYYKWFTLATQQKIAIYFYVLN